jgi:hypothetical protein
VTALASGRARPEDQSDEVKVTKSRDEFTSASWSVEKAGNGRLQIVVHLGASERVSYEIDASHARRLAEELLAELHGGER